MYIVYSKDNCMYCEAAKQLLKNKKEEFRVIDLNSEISLSEFKERYPQFRTVPQIFKDEEIMDNHIGGFDQLVKHFA